MPVQRKTTIFCNIQKKIRWFIFRSSVQHWILWVLGIVHVVIHKIESLKHFRAFYKLHSINLLGFFFSETFKLASLESEWIRFWTLLRLLPDESKCCIFCCFIYPGFHENDTAWVWHNTCTSTKTQTNCVNNTFVDSKGLHV